MKGQAFLFCYLLFNLVSFAQTNLHCNVLTGGKKTYQLDSLSIYPASIYVSDSTQKFTYNLQNHSIHFENVVDSLEVCYRTFLINFSDTLFLYQYDTLVDGAVLQRTIHRKNENQETFWETPNLYKSGNLSRGISVGNTQGVFVNSNLNLQIEGMLANDVNVKAVISDQNIPVQPEGNTQQIQDFDRVYIQVNTPKLEIVAGDVLFNGKQGAFLRYARNVQGGQFTYQQNQNWTGEGGIAISKGKFTSQIITTLDNVQGPYRLVGPNKERFIIVLANSEKVYLDGQLLKRGWDQDYIIDYNQSEITFTNKVVVTKYSRLRIDYEYSDKNYIRINQFANLTYQGKRGKINYQYYQEKDNEKRPLNLSLTEQDKLILSQIGDDLDRAFVSSYDSVQYRENAILYRIDSLEKNQVVFEYSVDKELTLYEVSFTEVVNGDYVKEQILGNGTVYKWTGKGEGTHLPVQKILTPQQKTMHTVHGEFLIHPKHRTYFEGALSTYDKNLYSELNQADNVGNAWLLGYQWKDSLKNYASIFTIEQQGIGKSFQEIDRFRNVDFERDWNATDLSYNQMNLTNASYVLQKNAYQKIGYQILYRTQDTLFKGIQHHIFLNQQVRKWRSENDYFYTNSEKNIQQANWNRFNTKLSYQGKKWIPSIRYAQDFNKIRDIKENVYLKPQLHIESWETKIATQDTSHSYFDASYLYQISKDTLNGELVQNEEIQQLQANWKQPFAKNKQQIAINTTYRFSLPFRENQKITENVMGQIEWKASLLKNIIKTNVFYQSQAGRILKREFLYVEVPLGEGTHIFKDFNDNKIQEINEFVEDPLIGNYVQTYVPTDEYINAYNTIFRYQVNIRFPTTWRKAKKIKQFLQRCSWSSSGNFDQKITNNSLKNRFNPLTFVQNEFLVYQKRSIKNTFFFNQSSPTYGIVLSHHHNIRKQLLTFGLDSSSTERVQFDTRIRLFKQWNSMIKSRYGLQKKENNYTEGLNYAIEEYLVKPEIYYQPLPYFRWTGFMGRKHKFNQWAEEKATFWEYGMGISWSKLSEQRIDAELTMLRVFSNQESNQSSPISFLILDGLQQGINWKWKIIWHRKIVKGLQLQLEYEARKPNAQKVIHVGKIQIVALF